MTLLVAIDISKHRHEVLIGILGRKRRRRLTITNALDDFQRLATALTSYDLPIRIGFEATGNYHRTLALEHEDLTPWELASEASDDDQANRQRLINDPCSMDRIKNRTPFQRY